MNSFSLRFTFGLFLTLLGSVIANGIARCEADPYRIAQIIPDHSLGAESSKTRSDTIKNIPSDVIEGGATRGSNLFHSFREFNVNEGRGAYFANPDVIQNIFSRVTGGNISQILGTLGVLGNANLFLINPSGIIFGPNARLDMRGAFIGATADSVVFDHNFEFSATNPNAPPLLTVNIPLGLRFRETPADITSTGNLTTPSHLTLKAGNLNIGGSLVTGGDLTLEALDTLTIRDSVISPFIAASGGNLLLQGNQSVDIYALNHPDSGIIAGGDLTLRSTNAVSGDAHYWSGGSFRIEKLDGTLGGLVSFYDPIIRTGGDVFIDAYEGASLHIIAGGKVEIPGYILITGADAQFGLQETITLSNGQQITIDGKNNPTVDIRAGVDPSVVGDFFFNLNDFFPFNPNSSNGIFNPNLGDIPDFSATPTSADINVGSIFIGIDSQDIIMGDVLLTNQYQSNPKLQGSITARSSQENFAAIKTGLVGDGGRVTIDSKGNINITGDINSTSLNTGGNVLLNSVGDTLIKNSKVDVNGNNVNGIISVTGKQGGNIQINANNITLSNMTLPALNGGNVLLNSVGDTVINKSTISVTGSQGGSIKINANNITLTTTLLLAGIGQGLGFENALGGDITLNAIQEIILDSSLIANYVQEKGTGNIGNVIINTSNLTLSGSSINSSTFGKGDAGTIQITATDSIAMTGESFLGASGILSQVALIEKGENGEEVVRGEGDSRGIVINTTNLTLENGAIIDSSTFATGNAGVIQINATDSIKITGESSLIEQSGITSQVAKSGVGNSGGIIINTSNLSLEDGGRIDATTFGKGDSGAITITATDSIKLTGESSVGQVSNIGSQVQTGIEGEGNSGGIVINTSTLTLEKGGGIYASTLSKGEAGAITITATDSINILGESQIGNLIGKILVSGIFSQVNQDGEEIGFGDSKGIKINTSTLTIQEGGGISANTFSLGNAGGVDITASDSITITGESLSGVSSNISSQVGSNKVGEITAEGNSGGVEINTGTLSLIDGGQVTANTFGKGDAGAIKITASDTIFAIGSSSGNQQNISSGITSMVDQKANGNSGGIEINTGTLSLLDGANVNASTEGMGNAGAIKITARDSISAIGENSKNNLSGIYSLVTDEAEGNSGGIEIITGSLFINDGANVNAGTGATGNAGAVKITARDTISITGENSQGNVSVISSIVGSKGFGQAGGIEINTGSLFINNGATVTASTRGVGNAGDIKITANDTISAVGQSSQGDRSGIYSKVEIFENQPAKGNAGEIEINTDNLSLTGGAQINSRTEGLGKADNITITANNLESTGGSEIRTDTQTNFDAGDIILNISDTLSLINSSLIAETTEAGIAGDITINAPQFNITDGAIISAKTSAQGNGGNITVNSPIAITLGEKSQLNVETSGAGKAGNIDITSNTVTIGKDAQISATAKKTASNTSGGGSININSSNLNIAGKLGIFAETQGESPAGTLTLNPDNANPNLNILFIEQGLISASTSDSGNGGDINISASDNIDINGIGTIATTTSGSGNAGTINLNTNQLSLTNGVTVTASTTIGTGNAGNINLNATQINLEQTQITAFTDGEGNAGSIVVPNAQTISLNNSTISTEIQRQGTATEPSDITLTSDTLNLDNSSITASTAGNGNAGDIKLINQQLDLNNSNITAISTGVGNAGSISLPSTQNLNLNQSEISVSTTTEGNAGSITAPTAQNINLNQSKITASTSGVGDTGTIELTGTEQIALTNNSQISNAVDTGGTGNAQTIRLNTPTLTLENSSITSSTNGTGNAGSIVVPNAQTINLTNSTISTEIQKDGIATEPSNINLTSNTLNLENSNITASTAGVRNAGEITLTNQQFNLNNSNITAISTGVGNAGSISLPSTQNLNLNQSQISVSTTTEGNAGSITVPTAQNINLNQSQITASTSGVGDTGTIALTGSEKIELNNSNISNAVELGGFGNAQTITLNTPSLSLDNSDITSSTDGTGNAGSIVVPNAQTITLDNSTISTEIQVHGVATEASNINLTSNTLNLDNSSITASTAGNGNAGEITLTNQQLVLNNSNIRAISTGNGNAGSITLPNTQNLNLNQSQISVSTTKEGNAGSITVPTAQTINLNQSQITASTSGVGDTGTIELTGTEQIALTNNSQISNAVETGGMGNAQTITLNTPHLILNNSDIISSTDGTGNAGSIFVPNAQTIALNNSTISTEIQKQGRATQASNITLKSDTLNLNNNSQINASTAGTGNAGEITLTNQQFNLNNSQISATSTGNGNAGSISLPSTQNLNLNQSQISVSTTNKGNAGSISVPNAQNINLNQSQITASTSGVGDTGTIELTGTEQIVLNKSEISNAVETGGMGNAQTITLDTPDLSLENSDIISSTDGMGHAGSIFVPNAQTIALNNSTISTEIQAQGTATEASNITIQTQQLTLDNNSQITATTSGNGDAGTITITTDSLTATDNSSIQTNTASSGNAGDLVFNLSNDLTLDNSTLEASTDPNSTGNGGSIRIDPTTVNLNNNALISVNSQGTGDGGNLLLEARNLSLRNNSEISATTASGEGGNITLNVADTVTQRNNSPISATAGGTGNGGNITLNTRFLVGNEKSNITANAFEGRGGNINITADGIFRGFNSPITASSQLGVDGVVQTNTPEVDPSRGLINLPQNPVDPNTLIAQNACRRGGQSEFTVTGRGGLPNTPEQVQRSNEVEVGLVEATEQTARSKPKKEILATRKIIPAQGWQRNDKGEMVLVATPTTENANRQTTMTDTCTSN